MAAVTRDTALVSCQFNVKQQRHDFQKVYLDS